MPTVTENAESLAAKLFARYTGERLMVGIAGPPGSGKSTIAAALEKAINARSAGLAAILPMDGFHFDDAVLRSLGLLPRKGAIETFDVYGLIHILRRLKENADEVIAVPVFDRSIEIARAGGRLIRRDTGIIVVEGNYLLARREPWARIRPLLDLSVMVATPEETLRERLTARWQHFGLPVNEIRRKVEENDLPNGRLVVAESAAPDLTITD